jgi:hypothetical protein
VNDSPILSTIGDRNTNEDTPLTISLTSTDIEEDDVAYSAEVNSGNVNAVVIGDQLTITPFANWNGIASIMVNADDGQGGTDSETFEVLVLEVNDPPTSFNATVSVNEDTVLPFSIGNFPYDDLEEDAFAGIRLQASSGGVLWVDLDSDNTLNNNEVLIENNDVLSISELTLLRFLPDLNSNGDAAASFDFEVFDGLEYSSSATLFVDVAAVNDAPASDDSSVTATENLVFTFGVGNFPYTDVENDPLASIRLQAPTAGTLWLDLDGDNTTSGQDIVVSTDSDLNASDIGKLKFLPEPNANGDAYATFEFKVFDGTDFSLSTHIMTIDVAAVNTLPTSANITILTPEDVP